MLAELDELPLPYKSDVTDYAAVDNSDLRKHINEAGKTLYQRENKPAPPAQAPD